MCPGGANKLFAFRMTTRIPHSRFVLTASRDAIEGKVSKRVGLIHNSREQFCWTQVENGSAAYKTDRNSSHHFLLSVSNDNLNLAL
jgi:hypothetical protein